MKISIVNENLTPALFLELLRRGLEKHGVNRISRCSVYLNPGTKKEIKLRACIDEIINQESTKAELEDVAF